MRFQRGDDVLVDWMGVQCLGEVIEHLHSGFVMAVITLPDAELDWGGVGAALDPQPTVCVRETAVRPLP